MTLAGPMVWSAGVMVDAEDAAFVEEHRTLVRKLALRVRAQLDLTTDLDELIAYGYSGLVEARGRFDPERGVQFTTFAYYRVRGAILDGVREMAYLPRQAHLRRKEAEALDREAEAAAVRRAETPEARATAKAALEAMDSILSKTCATYVIASVGQSDDDGFDDPEESLLRRETSERVRAALEVLDERERTLVEGYFFEDRTLDEMGKEMGISKSWASRVCSKALVRMRAALEPE